MEFTTDEIYTDSVYALIDEVDGTSTQTKMPEMSSNMIFYNQLSDKDVCVFMPNGFSIDQASLRICSYSRRCVRKLNTFDHISIVRTHSSRVLPIKSKSNIKNYRMNYSDCRGSFILKNPSISNLTYVDISNNNLTKLHLENVHVLREVYASSNCITDITIKNNPCLERLNLDNNKIVEITTDMSTNSSMAYLSLNNNKISYICTSYIPESLVFLFLNNNILTVCDVSNHEKLYSLSVNDNNLCLLLFENTKLVTVNAEKNVLIHVNPQKLFSSLPSLYLLNLKDNVFIEFDEVDDGEECVVCLEDMKLFRTYKFCLHRFCIRCSYTCRHCPLCRAPIYDNANYVRPISLSSGASITNNELGQIDGEIYEHRNSIYSRGDDFYSSLDDPYEFAF